MPVKRPKPKKPGFRERVLGMIGVMPKKEVDYLIWFEGQVSKFVKDQGISGELATALENLYNPFFGDRWRAAWKLGDLKDKQAVPLMAKALKDTDPGVRFGVVQALKNIGGKEAKAALKAALKKEKVKFVKDEIQESLKS